MTEYLLGMALGMDTEEHPHEHTTHALRDVIEALPRYTPWFHRNSEDGMEKNPDGEYLKLSDVRAVVHKAAVLGAPIAYIDEAPWNEEISEKISNRADEPDIKVLVDEFNAAMANGLVTKAQRIGRVIDARIERGRGLLSRS